MRQSVGQVSRLTAWLLIALSVLSMTPTESRRVKWLSYCHFDIGKQSFLIESLRCDKCYTFYEDEDDELIQEDMTLYDYVGQESLESFLLNKTQYDYIVARYHERNSIADINICKYYESKSAVYKKWHHHEYQAEQDETPLLSVVSKEWFDLDLLYLIKKGEILTNLNDMDLNYFADLAKNIKSVELINLGIDKVESDAFVKFESLKRLRISYNNLHYLNLSSLFAKTEIYMSKVQESRLEEIELSYNKLSSIFLDSSVYFSSLKVLNVSNNLMKTFDPALTATVMPSLKQLDLSYNLIKKFPLFKNYLIAASSLVSSSAASHLSSSSYETELNKTAGKVGKDRIKIKIKSSVVLHTLNLLNLNGNNLYSFADLFSLNLMLVNDSRFECDARNSSFSNKPPPKVIVSNNRWRCDCNSFEIISSMRHLLTSNKSITNDDEEYMSQLINFSAEKYSKSCYLFNLVEQNKPLFGEIFSNLSLKHLTCAFTNAYDISQKASWPSWYYQNCISVKDKETRLLELKRVFMSSKQPAMTTTTLRPVTITSSRLVRTTMVFIMQHSTRSHINNITPPASSSIRPHSFLKYDSYLSVLFFWIVCALIVILPFSCFFILWFYCCKKCKLYRAESSRRRHMNSIRGLSRMASVRENPSLSGRLESRSFRNQPTGNSANNLGLFYLSAANNAAFANNIYFDHQDQVSASNINDAEDYEDPPSYYDVISLKNVNLSMPHSLKGVSSMSQLPQRPKTNQIDQNDSDEATSAYEERSAVHRFRNTRDDNSNRTIINVISNDYRATESTTPSYRNNNRRAPISPDFDMNQFDITEHTIV